MADKLTAEGRSANMKRIKGKGMKPELAVRRIVHAMGYRYRLHRRDLPGTPDLVFGPRRKVIFVHGNCGDTILNAAGVFGGGTIRGALRSCPRNSS